MENAFSFISNYIQMSSFFVYGEKRIKEIKSQQKSISFTVYMSGRLCVNFHVGTFQVHACTL